MSRYTFAWKKLRLTKWRQRLFMRHFRNFEKSFFRDNNFYRVNLRGFQYLINRAKRISSSRQHLDLFANKLGGIKKEQGHQIFLLKNDYLMIKSYPFAGDVKFVEVEGDKEIYDGKDYNGIFLTYFYGLIGRRRRALYTYYSYLSGKLRGDEAYDELSDYANRIDKNRYKKGFMDSSDPYDTQIENSDPQYEYYSHTIKSKELPYQKPYYEAKDINYLGRYLYLLKSMRAKGWDTRGMKNAIN